MNQQRQSTRLWRCPVLEKAPTLRSTGACRNVEHQLRRASLDAPWPGLCVLRLQLSKGVWKNDCVSSERCRFSVFRQAPRLRGLVWPDVAKRKTRTHMAKTDWVTGLGIETCRLRCRPGRHSGVSQSLNRVVEVRYCMEKTRARLCSSGV